MSQRSPASSWVVQAASGTSPHFGGGFSDQDSADYLWMPWSQQVTLLLLSPVLRSGLILGSTP